MRALILLLPLCLYVYALQAQKPPIKFGDVSMEDLKMTRYDNDSSAAAVILADYGEARIDINLEKLIFERHTRIKILKKDGAEWANVSIPLYHNGSSKEKVSGLKAITYNLENGKVTETKMSNAGVFEEKFNKQIDHQKFTLPNVKEGSVIEYTYKVYSDFFIHYPNWQFQEEIPTIWSEYRAAIPEFFIYQKYMQGYVILATVEEKDLTHPGYREKVHRWIAKDVPAFKEEPYMTSIDDYISKMNFALSHINLPGRTQEIMGSWEKMNAVYLKSENFGELIDGSGFLKKTVEEVTSGVNEPKEKLEKIYNYVKTNVEWNEVKDVTSDNATLRKIFETKKGTSADINLLLTSMLRKAGLEVDPVLVSTRDHGFVRVTYPMESQFNYVICAVRMDDKTMLLDATEKLLPMNILPERCLNGQGLVISKKYFGWINLESLVKSKTVINTDIALDAEGKLKGKIQIIRDGYDAHRMRKNYVSKGQEEYIKEMVSSKSWELVKSDFQSVEKLQEQVKEIHEVVVNEHTMVAGDVIYLNPLLTYRTEQNPFRLESREYPVDFGSMVEKVYLCRLTLPEGYDVEELPESKVMMLPGNAARFLYNVSKIGNTISVTSNLSINKSIFVQQEYPNLREFYNQMVAKQAENIVLKKIN
jgi:hypothetical protein